MIIPLIVSDVNYQSLIKTAKEALDRHISSDSKARNIEIISKFFNKNTTEKSLLRHSFYGFLVFDSYDTFTRLVMESSLNINIINTIRADTFVGIISGNLQQWIDSIINYNSTYELRLLIKEILKYFDTIGLSEIFSSFRRCLQKDGTYILEFKK